jgi:CcmD family protein
MGLVGCLLPLLAGTLLASQPEPPGEFVPVAELPPGDELPAAPLLIAAYAFVWVILVVYLSSIWRRVQKVNAELAALARRVGQRS